MTERIVTPTGFLKVVITIDEEMQKANLRFTKSSVELFMETTKDEDEEFAFATNGFSLPVIICNERIIPLKTGNYKVRARLETLSSDWKETVVKIGEQKSLEFHFGKE